MQSDHVHGLRAIADQYAGALRDVLGEALVSVVLFGSVARGEATATSDIDLLVVAEDLPPGRLARQDRIRAADEAIQVALQLLRRQGIFTDVHVLLKSPAEAVRL